MSRIRLKHQQPDAATRRRIKDGLRCWSCAAEPKLSFAPRQGLTATITHLADCRVVPAEHRAAGRTACVIREPEVFQAIGITQETPDAP